MAIVLGLLVALTYGTGDFFGGLAAKRSASTTVVIGSFGVATVLLAIVSLTWTVFGEPPTPSTNDLWLGVATGTIGPLGVGFLYYGLASGRMSVVAPITAVVAAIVPLGWGLGHGERPSGIALAGVVVALLAIGLISSAPAHEDHPTDAATMPMGRIVPVAVISGLAFGTIFVLLGSTSADAGVWPLMVARPIAVTLTVVVALVLGRRAGTRAREAVVPTRASWPMVAGAGVLDITANVFYLAATNTGLLSIVAVISSLYPAATVALARVFLGERLHRIQLVGLALAAMGIAAMATG